MARIILKAIGFLATTYTLFTTELMVGKRFAFLMLCASEKFRLGIMKGIDLIINIFVLARMSGSLGHKKMSIVLFEFSICPQNSQATLVHFPLESLSKEAFILSFLLKE